MKERTEKQKALLKWMIEVRKHRRAVRQFFKDSDERLQKLALQLELEKRARAWVQSAAIPPPPPGLFLERGGTVTPPTHYSSGITVQIAPGQDLSDEHVEKLAEKIKRRLG